MANTEKQLEDLTATVGGLSQIAGFEIGTLYGEDTEGSVDVSCRLGESSMLHDVCDRWQSGCANAQHHVPSPASPLFLPAASDIPLTSGVFDIHRRLVEPEPSRGVLVVTWER